MSEITLKFHTNMSYL